MSLHDVQGQPRAIEALRSALKGGTVHHAYLFAGPEGVGKELTAVGLAQALGCEKDPLNGCNECNHCVRVAKRNHPDVTWILPEDEQVARKLAGRSDFPGTPSREIKVEQIRNLQERLALRALEGGKKVVILGCAQTINEKAQNAFLKTLEEPPRETVLILVASEVDRLLPTIRSRCSKVPFGPLPVELIAERVKRDRKLEADLARLVGVLAGGSMSRALDMDLEGLKRRKEIIERFEALPADDARPLLRYAEELASNREEAESVIRILQLWTRDVALAQVQSGGLANDDLAPLAKEVAARISEVSLHRRQELFGEALVAMDENNASPRLQMERLLIGVGGRP
ncbi:MAG: DNA polymerase III subunit delta' [Myxococcaceae bacterium]